MATTKIRIAARFLGVFAAMALTWRGYMLLPQSQLSSNEITIGFPGAWGSLIPPNQHTSFADAILGNEFEPLVDMERGGLITPFAAKSWRISDDMKTFTFKIDTERKFSDGSNLTAHDFKRSWEDGLKLSSKTLQKSQMDVVYKIAGFDEYEKTGHLSGLEAVDEETLIVQFSSPFRMALDHLTGSRFAAYKFVNGHYIGTGPYTIIREEPSAIFLKKNEYSRASSGFEQIKIVRKSADECASAVLVGDIDVYAYAGRNFYNGPCNSEPLSCLNGFEAAHVIVSVNGFAGRTFSNSNLRKALQYLLTQVHDGVAPQSYFQNGVLTKSAFDSQPFMPLQAGRLSDEEAISIIDDGKPFVADLIKYSERNPLSWSYVANSKITDAFKNILERHGVNLAPPKIAPTIVDLITIADVNAETDLTLVTKSVVDGDPDGIYHALGRKGAIVTPMTLRDRVSDLLEDGRSITDTTKLDEHYQRAARAILEDVPWVHLGFSREQTVYRSDRLKVNYRSIKSRIREPFSIFEPK